ncbi:MAG: hypothetical protein JSV62_14890 [Promethearchaeota archaeon]|nr:MAG: hypothetical protein JSV62_14890 [Candidatus Lokiarchaeota archaeon]
MKTESARPKMAKYGGQSHHTVIRHPKNDQDSKEHFELSAKSITIDDFGHLKPTFFPKIDFSNRKYL